MSVNSTAATAAETPEVADTQGMNYLVSLPRRVVTVYLPLGAFLFVLLFPFYWMAITTFKPILHISVPTVQEHVSLALKKIKEYLSKHADIHV